MTALLHPVDLAMPRGSLMSPQESLHITPVQVGLVRTTFRILMLERDRFAEMFYARLITLDPEIRARLPHSTMTEQRAQLMQVLGGIVELLDDSPLLQKRLAALARRYTVYGSGDRKFQTAKTALAWSVDRILDQPAASHAQAAWAAAFDLVEALLGGARPQA